MAQANINAPVGGNFPVWLEAVVGPYDGVYRVGVSGQTSAADLVGYIASMDGWPSHMYAEDIGPYTGAADGGINTMGGVPYSGAANTGGASTKTYTASWTPAATRVWRGSTVVSGNLMQGSYSGISRYSMWHFGAAPSNAMAGGTITSLTLTVQNVDFPMNPGGAGRLRLGWWAGTSVPASPVTSGGDTYDIPMSGGQKLVIKIPSAWWPYFASGARRAFIIGADTGTGVAYYGHFSPTATLTATFTK